MRLLIHIGFLWLFLPSYSCFAQAKTKEGKADSLYGSGLQSLKGSFFDSSHWVIDSVPPCKCQLRLPEKLPTMSTEIPRPGRSSDLIHLAGGSVNYQFTYQSSLDTPFKENNVFQHNALLQLNGTLAGVLPLQARIWTRQTNSSYYRDITDFQVSYDRTGWQSQVRAMAQKKLGLAEQEAAVTAFTHCIETEIAQLALLEKNFSAGEWRQRLVEAYEILRVPGITYDLTLPDSINKKREQVQQQNAAVFIEWYEKFAGMYSQASARIDSLRQLGKNYAARLNLVKGMMEKPDWQQLLADRLREDSLPGLAHLPRWVLLLSGLRNISIGRTAVNSSELTAKNITANGFSFEYDRKIYLAATVGGIDYRFRDLAISGNKRNFNPFYLLRVGIGGRNTDHLILSGYSGRKNWPVAGDQRFSVRISGVSLEAKKMLGRNWWLVGEVAQSAAPNYRTDPLNDQTKLGFNGQANHAFAFSVGGFSPRLQYRIEAGYRKSGQNFQSFSNWQMNTALTNWSVKWDQSFWKKRIRLQLALRTSQWENSYLPQAYSTSSIIKSGMLVFQQRKLPAVSIGYIPVSQLARLGTSVMETRYQMISGNIWHSYRLGSAGLSSSISFLRSFDGRDPLLQYQNSRNLQLSQSVYFRLFTSSLSVSFIQNPLYKYDVWDHRIQVPLFNHKTIIGFGTKVYHYNLHEEKLGLSLNGAFSIFKTDQLSFFFEKAYLPGLEGALTPADMGHVQFTKSLHFNRSIKKN